jgi:hypothetical protein
MVDDDAYDDEEDDGDVQESDLGDLDHAEEAARFQVLVRLNLESWIRNLIAIRELDETNDCPEEEECELAN